MDFLNDDWIKKHLDKFIEENYSIYDNWYVDHTGGIDFDMDEVLTEPSTDQLIATPEDWLDTWEYIQKLGKS